MSERRYYYDALIEDVFKPVHEAVAEALTRLVKHGVIGRTYFNAREGTLIIWMGRPGPELGGGES